MASPSRDSGRGVAGHAAPFRSDGNGCAAHRPCAPRSPAGSNTIINWEPHNRADAIDVAIGGKADMTFCGANVCFFDPKRTSAAAPKSAILSRQDALS